MLAAQAGAHQSTSQFQRGRVFGRAGDNMV